MVFYKSRCAVLVILITIMANSTGDVSAEPAANKPAANKGATTSDDNVQALDPKATGASPQQGAVSKNSTKPVATGKTTKTGVDDDSVRPAEMPGIKTLNSR